MSSPDPFDSILNLEQTFYQQGYTQGLADGAQAGRTEGRQFGMQTGFEKFLESGRLASRAIIWANRMPPAVTASEQEQEQEHDARDTAAATATPTCSLPPLPRNARLHKNVKMLYALVEPETLSTENSDEGVQDFDDRVKRAQGKAKVVERMAS
ncbi:hypothetical protein E4U47_006939 [Claviceps purpurea]|nr:hypothetical protein E4U37_004082 [Claviceps purpurea]KAG6233242.1 hypothetical protein E4U26_002825 [Claviceps purpurea]KAG6241852.1 hypothetical protein E4U25_005393 [Claviceps purpurea]KAG6277631.1 hypothetical protein E4U47_006939 [Claviceps purpurea]